MFVLDSNPTFTHPVTVNVPVDGGHDAQTFKATFRVMNVSEIVTYDFADDGNGATSTSFLQGVLVGFEDVQGADGQPVLFSDRTRDALIDLPYVRQPLSKAYFAGTSSAQLGN